MMRMRTSWRVVSGPARTAGGRCPTLRAAGCPTLGSGPSSPRHGRRRRHDLDLAADPARPRADRDGLYYAERVFDSAALTAWDEGSLTQAAVDAEVAERANVLAFRLGQRPPHTHDYDLSGEIQ